MDKHSLRSSSANWRTVGLKVALRKQYLRMRKDLGKEKVLEKSNKICQRLLRLKVFEKAQNISLYLPINKEVETKEIIDFLTKKGKSVFVPQFRRSEYRFCKFKSWDDLAEGPLGILQPKIQKTIDSSGLEAGVLSSSLKIHFISRTGDFSLGISPKFLDVAILPGIAFDKRSVRLGYGKGVFDKLLANSPAIKIGLAYDFQIVEKLPREKHDLVMDMVVTEKRVMDYRL